MKQYRLKCSCGEVINGTMGSVCPRCRRPIPMPGGGIFTLYRMGSPIGVAGAVGIYINGEPYGHIGNRETVHIPLEYGTYNIHVAMGVARRCQDILINITPESNFAYAKASIRMGFWTNSFVIQAAEASEMPELPY